MKEIRQPRPSRLSSPERYEIRLQGHISQDWSSWIHEARASHSDDGLTTVVGQVEDQAALHGMLARIRDLGVAILSVKRLC